MFDRVPPTARRYICLDFETNGFPTRGAERRDWPLPFSSFPIQISVDIVEEGGEAFHAFDTTIHGATNFAPWVREHVPITLEQVRDGKALEEVIADLAELIQEGDTLVAHNAHFDLVQVLARTVTRLGITSDASEKVLAAPRFCTMRCAYSASVFPKWPSLADLCQHFGVALEGAHDARADSAALAACVAAAHAKGVMLM